MAYRGMVTAPHHLAAQAGRDVLREGGNAVEAMVAAAAAIAVLYPHMNSIGGDGFWLIHRPEAAPVAIDACGAAAGLATPDFYAAHGFRTIPSRGPLAANTVAGTVSGWRAALELAGQWGTSLPLADLLAPAIEHAREGIAVTASQSELTTAKLDELRDVPGFSDQFLIGSAVPKAGQRFLQDRLASTLEQLVHAGLDDFYRGDLAHSIAQDFERVGSPLRVADLEKHHALRPTPLSVRLEGASLFNLPPPTQGLASLLIHAIAEQSGTQNLRGSDYLHAMVECTKQAFLVRDQVITDPAYMTEPAAAHLQPERVAAMAAAVDFERALPWPYAAVPGDTIWMGAVDSNGWAVSFIQSIFWEFGSGVVLPGSGIHWQNRGASFRLEPGNLNELMPGRRPFHTLNPALALFDDGRTMIYGTMGGEGQPQTQAAVYTRYAHHNMPLQAAVTAPRWLLGRTWGEQSTTLKLERGFDLESFETLTALGHVVEWSGAFDSLMGHAGAVVRHCDGMLEGAADPRSEGGVAAW